MTSPVKKSLAALVFGILSMPDSDAAIMRNDIDTQDYRDFAENLGKYAAGQENVKVF